MKKELFAAILLAALIAGSALNIRHIESLTNSIILQAELAASSVKQGEFSTAARQLQTGIDIWLSADSYTHIFIRHPELDSTTDVFYELREAIAAQDADAVPALREKLIYHLRSISDMEKPSLGSIL